jgi:ribokinase
VSLLVVGNACLDIVLALDRLPAAGETRLATGSRREPGGKGLNQAVAARRAGAPVRLVAAIGTDDAGSLVRTAIVAEGLPEADLVGIAGAGDLSVVMVDALGENAIASTAEAAAALQPPPCLADLGPADLLLVQGNLTAATTGACLAAARERGARTLANLAPIAFDWRPLLPLVDLAIVNGPELQALGGAESLLAGGVGRLVATRGAAGALLLDHDGERPVAAPAVRAVDTAGAGDTLCGVLAAGLLAGLPAEVALAWAVRAASLTVTRPGTFGALPTAAELAGLRPS